MVLWQQQLLPYRFSLGADDAGSKATGKYQGNLTFAADNPFGLSDLFYVSYGHDLGHKASYTDSAGHTTGSGSCSLALQLFRAFRQLAVGLQPQPLPLPSGRGRRQ